MTCTAAPFSIPDPKYYKASFYRNQMFMSLRLVLNNIRPLEKQIDEDGITRNLYFFFGHDMTLTAGTDSTRY